MSLGLCKNFKLQIIYNSNIFICDNTLLADLQSNYSWPLESSSGFSHLRPGVFHIFYQHTKYTTEGVEEKKNKQTGLG